MLKGKLRLFGLCLATSLFFSMSSTSLYATKEQKGGLFFATGEEISQNAIIPNIIIENHISQLPDLTDYSSLAYNVKDVELNEELRTFFENSAS